MQQTNISLTVLFVLIFGWYQVQGQPSKTYQNPVIAGNFPDPSVIRVGDTYYAAGTSSEWAPAYRLYQSKDLVNWQYMGALFKDIPEWTMGSFWAPELYYRNGTYFVYYTARRKSDQRSFIGVATTKDIQQGFTDHGLIIEWTSEAIDAFVVEDGGKTYVTWKAYGLDHGRNIEIIGAELSVDGLQTVGEPFNLLTAENGGWEDGGIEGQCLVRHGNHLYLFYAGNSCCGANCNYMTGVARAKSIKGPWEKYQGNPILKSSTQWRCPGHGTLVETADKRYFYLYHAYNASNNIYLGRQGLLDEVVWDKKTGWPEFRYGKTPSLQAETPLAGTIQQPTTPFSDNFANPSLRKEWAWDVHQPRPTASLAEGVLELQGTTDAAGSFMGVQVEKDRYTFKATIRVNDLVAAGVCVYGTKDAATGISAKGNRLEVWNVRKGALSILASEPIAATDLTLCLTTTFGQYCQFGWIKPNGSVQAVGPVIHINDLPQWDRPPLVGIQVAGKGAGVFSKVEMD